jgi:hypothetical protein
VTFTPATGSGSVSPSSVATDASGVATLTSWTLGTTAGPQSVVASASRVSSVTFHATAQPGPGARYVVTASPTTQIAGSTSAITAQLVDAFGNLASESGRAVNWTSTNGGSFASPSQTTGANGATPAQAFRTTTSAGVTHTITATDGTSSSINGSATVSTVAGPAAQLVIAVQTPVSA